MIVNGMVKRKMLPFFKAESSRRAKYDANASVTPDGELAGATPAEPLNVKVTDVISRVVEKPTTDTDIPFEVL